MDWISLKVAQKLSQYFNFMHIFEFFWIPLIKYINCIPIVWGKDSKQSWSSVNMLDAHYLWVCHLSIHIWFNHNWALKLRNQYHVDGRTQNQICSKPSLLYFVVVQGLIYSTAKTWVVRALQYTFYGVPSNSMVGQEKRERLQKRERNCVLRKSCNWT